jgi:hypothetical protein
MGSEERGGTEREGKADGEARLRLRLRVRVRPRRDTLRKLTLTRNRNPPPPTPTPPRHFLAASTPTPTATDWVPAKETARAQSARGGRHHSWAAAPHHRQRGQASHQELGVGAAVGEQKDRATWDSAARRDRQSEQEFRRIARSAAAAAGAPHGDRPQQVAAPHSLPAARNTGCVGTGWKRACGGFRGGSCPGCKNSPKSSRT